MRVQSVGTMEDIPACGAPRDR